MADIYFCCCPHAFCGRYLFETKTCAFFLRAFFRMVISPLHVMARWWVSNQTKKKGIVFFCILYGVGLTPHILCFRVRGGWLFPSGSTLLLFPCLFYHFSSDRGGWDVVAAALWMSMLYGFSHVFELGGKNEPKRPRDGHEKESFLIQCNFEKVFQFLFLRTCVDSLVSSNEYYRLAGLYIYKIFGPPYESIFPRSLSTMITMYNRAVSGINFNLLLKPSSRPAKRPAKTCQKIYVRTYLGR